MLQRKRLRLGSQISHFSTRVVHEAKCPQIAPPQCEQSDIEPHLHDQGIFFYQAQLNGSLLLHQGLQISANLPLDIKHLTIEYRKLSDNSAYDPAYAGIHHRNETLIGLGDATLSVEYFKRYSNLVLGFGIGSSIPLGRTEENPYTLGMQGKEHQHFQMGSGVFSPVASGLAIWSKPRWGIVTDIRAQLSLYENAKTYQPPTTVFWGSGPWWAFSPKLRLLGQLRGQYESREKWAGKPSPNTGKTAFGAAGAVMWKYHPDWEFMLRAERNLVEKVLEESPEYENDRIPPAFVFTAGLTWWR